MPLCRWLPTTFVLFALATPATADDLERLKYQHDGLVVDLGVGLWAWPLPMDYDGDGDLDLLVACPDKPFNGVWLFENPGQGNKQKMPVFKPPVRLGPATHNMQVSHVDGVARVLRPGHELVDFRNNGFEKAVAIHPKINIHPSKLRANQWRYVDFDGDGVHDLVVGAEDWSDYGWDDAYDATGRWTNGPLHGYVYVLLNRGANDRPDFAEPFMLEADGKPVDGFGMPSPSFADFDGDGDLDLICGEFLDGFTYYENIGSRSEPKYAAGRRLKLANGQPIAMHVQMITPVAIDWDADGHVDLICGDEDGRVALIEHTGKVVDGTPVFSAPRYFKQQADDVKFGALAAPSAIDWDGDGDDDLIVGNTSGQLAWIENLGGDPPRWAAPELLKAGGETIRILAGPNGSIQGPAEAKWGYTAPCACDWNNDGLPDIVINNIWGEVLWYQNVGTRQRPQLRKAQPVLVEWEGEAPKPEWVWWKPQGKQLVTQWRTSPCVADITGNGLPDLAMLDTEGYFALYERVQRNGELLLLPPRRVFLDTAGKPLQLNPNRAGKSGRRKIALADWDGDGRIDILINDKNCEWLRNVSDENTPAGHFQLESQGLLAERLLAGHDTCPTTVDFNGDGVRDLVLGAEDGRFYYLKNKLAPRPANTAD